MDRGRLAELLEEVSGLARRAGDAILATILDPEDLEVEEKDDGSPVTRADRAANDVLVAGLRALEPGLVIVSEEGDLKRTAAAAGDVYWLVDPLDGTKEFLAGRAEYTVNVALVEGGEAILGVVQVPVDGRLYLGARGLGARRVDGGSTSELTPAPVDRPRSAVVSRSHLTPPTEEFLERLGITERTAFGSSLKICAVAEGLADIYPRFGPTSLWDTAAGAALATAAGCDVVDLKGHPLRYLLDRGLTHSGFVVAVPGALEACLPALASDQDG
jgi:3'(2'), 5'-bisphosphate nucleotidase